MSDEETLLEIPKRKQEEAELDITAMIDVTFLLLAFFVVVSRMDPQAAVQLPLATYGEAISAKDSVTLIVTEDEASPDAATVFLGKAMSDESKVPAEDNEETEGKIGEWVENEFLQNPTKTSVLIKAAGGVKTRFIEVVKRGVSRSELAKQRSLYIGIEEDQ